MFALSVDRGSAAEQLGLAAGDAVTLERTGGDGTTAPLETPVRTGRRDGGSR
jgi:hypothetical protein